MNYYRILGVPFSASRKEIKTAFRTLAKECHPDLHPGDPEAEKRFKQLNKAYSILSDVDARKRYHLKLLESVKRKQPPQPNSPRPLTKQEIADFMTALAEEKRMIQLRKKMIFFILPIVTVPIYLGFLRWAWNNNMLNWQYAIIILVASIFLAIPPTSLIWVATFGLLRRKARR